MKKKEISFYAEKEEPKMRQFQKAKFKIIKPLIWLLTKMGVTANMMTLFVAFVAIGSLVYAIYHHKPLIFIIGLWLNVVLDGFDGSLARYQKTASSKGTLMDAISDYLVINRIRISRYNRQSIINSC